MPEIQRELYPGGGGNTTPIPDPTSLTSAALAREIAALRELMEARIAGRQSTVDTRLDDMDKAIVVLGTIRDRLPAEMEVIVAQRAAIIDERFGTMDERFRGIQTQFEEREVRARETATLLQTALAAALQAQKEAAGEQVKTFKESISVSEGSTVKQIDALSDLLRSSNHATNSKIDLLVAGLVTTISDVKDRISGLDGKSSGMSGRDAASTQYLNIAIVLIGFAITIAIALTR